jgi:hypothetical protein
MWGFIKGIDWQATGVLAITVWQAFKEWRARRDKKTAPKKLALPGAK